MRDRIPEATVARLPIYLQALVAFEEQGVETVSSDALAQASGVNPAKLRKDLSHLGSFGTRGVGYSVEELLDGISDVLGLTTERPVVIVGIGNLGRALASYGGFLERGFRIAALVDADEEKVGTEVAGHRIEPLEALEAIVRERGVAIAVLATPSSVATDVAQRLVTAGITAILNFAPAHLDVPGAVTVRKVDLSTELQVLSFYDQLAAGDVGDGAAIG